MGIKERLKELRTLAQLPQRKVAAAMDIDTATYCKFEKGALSISREQLLTFARYVQADEKKLLALWLAERIHRTVFAEDRDVVHEALTIVLNQ